MNSFDTNDYGYVKTDNIFSGKPPSFDWEEAGGGVNWDQPFGIDTTGRFDLPGLSGTGALAERSDESWLNKGLEALNKALSYKNQGSTFGGSSKSRNYRGYGSSSPAVSEGRGYTVYTPSPTQKTKQTGGSSGIGSTLGTLAGIGVSLIPGVGQVAAAAAPTIGRTIGGFFG